MKAKIAKITALLMAASMCISLAGCGDSKTEDKTEKDQVNEALSELDEQEKEELGEVKDEINAEINAEVTDVTDTSSEAEAPAEDLGLKDPKYYTYYEDLAKSYAESNINSYAGEYFYTAGVSDPVCANGKVYIGSTKSGTKLYSYDIASGSLETVLDFQKGDGKYSYSSWFVKGDDLYLLYDETVYGNDHIEKVGKDGTVTDYDLTEGYGVNKIEYVFDNGKILCDVNSSSYFEVYDPAEKKLTKLDPIPVPSDHAGVTQDAERPMFMFAKGNSFFFGNTRSSTMGGPYLDEDIIYEYNTDTNEATVFYTDEVLSGEDPQLKMFGDYMMIDCKDGLKRNLTVIKISDGTKIVDGVRNFAPYLGGDGSYYRPFDNTKWFKLKYPDSTYTGTIEEDDTLIEAAEEFAEEPADSSSHIFQLDDKYYVIEDDAGYFLRTYEKGSADEQLIMTTKQVNGEE
jgi:hypothetical protein